MAPTVIRSTTSTDLGLEAGSDVRNLDFRIGDRIADSKTIDGKALIKAARDMAFVGARTAEAREYGQGATLVDDVSPVRAGERVALAKIRDRAMPVLSYIRSYRNPNWNPNQGDTPRCVGFSLVRAWIDGPDPRSAADARAVLLRFFTSVDPQVVQHARSGSTWHPIWQTTGVNYTETLGSMNDQAVFDLLADVVYLTAQYVDRYVHGWYFYGGATMLAGGKAVVMLSMAKAYWFGYTVAEYIAARAIATPILGIDWDEGFDAPDSQFGVMHMTWSFRGGHAIASNHTDLDDAWCWLDQSWGKENWGIQSGTTGGRGRLRFSHLEALLGRAGEVLCMLKTPRE